MYDKEYKQMHALKRTIHARFHYIGNVSGYDRMLVLNFLSDLFEELNSYYISDGDVVHNLASCFSNHSLYDSHVRVGRSTHLPRLCASWKYIVHCCL